MRPAVCVAARADLPALVGGAAQCAVARGYLILAYPGAIGPQPIAAPIRPSCMRNGVPYRHAAWRTSQFRAGRDTTTAVARPK